jgi:hypothetical protein
MAAVSLAEVKLHLNITNTTNDAELSTFIETAQQIVEQLVGPVEPRTFTETFYRNGAVLFSKMPVISITSVMEYGATVSSSLYVNDGSGELLRTDGRSWYGSAAYPLVVEYIAGRAYGALPATIAWGIKEQTAHLWRTTQSQRGGRSRGDEPAAPIGFALPSRVREALAPYLLIPAVG